MRRTDQPGRQQRSNIDIDIDIDIDKDRPALSAWWTVYEAHRASTLSTAARETPALGTLLKGSFRPLRCLAAILVLAVLFGCAGDGSRGTSMTISDCLEPTRTNSADIRRNLSRIQATGLCYRQQQVHEGRFRWTFHILEHQQHPQGPFWILPHDNEDTAFEVAVQTVIDYGGGLLAVDSGGQRNFLGQDPNRNFSRSHAESRRCRGQREPAPGYSQAVLDHYRDRRGPVLALHNNHNGWSGNGGVGTISMARESASLRAYPGARLNGNPGIQASRSNISGRNASRVSSTGTSSSTGSSNSSNGSIKGNRRLGDEDNLIFVVGSAPLSADPALKRRVAALNAAGLNVMHKQLNSTNFDCSLSDYVARHRLGEYYNIEAEHGDRQTQQQMVERLLAVLGIERLSAPRTSSPFLQQ
ncbi:hypothetical protein CKO42_11425 [Lamprobacter modestohalophilus]|uniref:Uncharacterized protein n=1 Tax=Lamprobacter modestohalophilus TaxID=1064514 RepID=A0A9X0W8Q7_9GAMM|nr:hypothetical protein [Lamprobacter modestohalophilus]MBK1619030.1 hypothetical protein [Lamprobacter modestohalophilus]